MVNPSETSHRHVPSGDVTTSRWKKLQSGTVVMLLVWQFMVVGLLTLAGPVDPKLAVMAKMLWGLVLIWIVGGGTLSFFARQWISHWGKGKSRPVLGVVFFTLATLMALAEEAVTTAMTNAAPWFGAPLGEVYITASANYLDVVLFHSVVVFLPQFALWAAVLTRYRFPPFAVFLCYGITGAVNEAIFSGPNPLLLAQWILVYGLMLYLPACLFVHEVDRPAPARWMYIAMILLPIFASLPMVALLLWVIAPGHPSVHFPPM